MKRPLLLAPLLLAPLLLASCATRDVTDTSGGAIDGSPGGGGDGGQDPGGASGSPAGGAGTGGAGAGGATGKGGSGQGGAVSQGGAGQAGSGPAGSGGSQPFGGGGAGAGGDSPFGGGGTAGVSGKGGSAGPGGGGTAGVSGKGGAGSGQAGTGNAGSGNGGSGNAGSGNAGQGGGGATGALCTYSGTGLDDPCYTCWNQAQTGSCAKEHDACAGDAECSALQVCWDQCTSDDEKCAKKCSSAHPDGAGAFQLLQSCLCGFACEAECKDQCTGLSSLNRCKHDVCTSGYDLDPDCSPCAQTVCEQQQACCDIGWDGFCVSQAEKLCGCPAPGTCLHSECATGAPLDPACSTCAQAVCATYPLCCDPFGKWDLACANAVASLCSP